MLGLIRLTLNGGECGYLSYLRYYQIENGSLYFIEYIYIYAHILVVYSIYTHICIYIQYSTEE